ncbi:MAG: hypothetical protein MUF23_05765 [Pirellula sp.]|nr:hypothetical protein [Pirellula sp.]
MAATPLAWAAPRAWSQSDASPTSSVVHWPRKDFVIPFQIDPSGEVPAEVRLEVSSDGGKSWTLYTRGDVRTRQFHYQAPSDGQFRFRLKTVDRSGNVFDNPGEPLVVAVDTTKPSGELLVDVNPRGVMQAEFRLIDAALDSSSIKLEYQTELTHQWIEVEHELQSGTAEGEWVGFGSWDMPSEATQLMVRVKARDQAGNGAEWTRMPRLPRTASTRRDMKLASSNDRSDPSTPIGSGILRRPVAGWPNPDVPKPEVPKPEVPRVEVLGGPGARKSAANVDRDSLVQQQVVESQQRLIEYQNRLLMQQRAVGGLSNSAASLLPTRPVDDSTLANAGQDPGAIPPSNLPTPGTLVTSPMQMASNPPMLPNNAATSESDPKTLYSNSRQFSLDYAIDNDPGAAIISVELWGTTDQGASWEKWGTDEDRQSPFDIEVEEEGLFGFRMVIVGANGLASHRPLPGDEADAWIRVDTTAPQARMISVLNGKGPDAGSLVIEYLAIDDYFGERPISFFAAATPKGPWQPIAQGARNSSRYVWTPDLGLPPTVYLRMEAVDAAGNVTEHQMDLPVDVQAAAPRGRIQGFRPQR